MQSPAYCHTLSNLIFFQLIKLFLFVFLGLSNLSSSTSTSIGENQQQPAPPPPPPPVRPPRTKSSSTLNGGVDTTATIRRQSPDLRIFIVWIEKLEDAASFPIGIIYFLLIQNHFFRRSITGYGRCIDQIIVFDYEGRLYSHISSSITRSIDSHSYSGKLVKVSKFSIELFVFVNRQFIDWECVVRCWTEWW